MWGPPAEGDADSGGGASWRWIARDNPAAADPTDFALVRRARAGASALRGGR